MAKKKKKKKGSDFLTSAHNIWLAGLGGLAAAEEEGGKLFQELVERGKTMEVRLTDPVEKAGTSLRENVKSVRERAGKTFKSIETAIDDQVATALGRLGVPTSDEIVDLTRRVETLTRNIEGVRSGGRAKKKAAKKKAAGKKTTRKKTAKKPTTKKKAR
jgi:poly(hydroxyalkanoate) granule-associated protein